MYGYFDFPQLDERTRTLMLAEVEHDIDDDTLYTSPRLTTAGAQAWPNLLQSACQSGTDSSLANELGRYGVMRDMEMRKTGPAKVPHNANETLAEGEFNRFYIRALCQRAIEDNIEALEIFRAKEVRNARSRSERKVGTFVDPQTLLKDLRSNTGVNTALGIPPGPNSGLSVRILA